MGLRVINGNVLEAKADASIITIDGEKKRHERKYRTCFCQEVAEHARRFYELIGRKNKVDFVDNYLKRVL